jgi:hypothetical protein
MCKGGGAKACCEEPKTHWHKRESSKQLGKGGWRGLNAVAVVIGEGRLLGTPGVGRVGEEGEKVRD